MNTKERLEEFDKINAEARVAMTPAEIDAENIRTRAIGRAHLAAGKQEFVDPVIRNESQVKIDAAAKKAYREGRKDERAKWTRKQEAGAPRLGRPPKYDFSSLKVGDTLLVDSINMRNIYLCGCQWAQRNAPSRKFRVKPAPGGSIITRWQ